MACAHGFDRVAAADDDAAAPIAQIRLAVGPSPRLEAIHRFPALAVVAAHLAAGGFDQREAAGDVPDLGD